ncbi:MAG: DoxX family membrane protein [Actinomycetota bacterium]
METAVRTLQPRGPAYQGYLILRVGFVLVPILSGVDKFFNFMVEWPRFLAPWVDDLMPGSDQEFMYVVGAIEIVAGIVVLLSPKWGSLLVAAWLGAIVVNLLTFDPPRYYDIAARDFAIMLAALTLNRLATAFGATTVVQETRHLKEAA